MIELSPTFVTLLFAILIIIAQFKRVEGIWLGGRARDRVRRKHDKGGPICAGRPPMSCPRP